MPSSSPPAANASALLVWAVVCTACDLTGHPQPDRPAAAALAHVHDELHHAGRHAAQLAELGAVCESCRRALTAAAVDDGDGRRFGVCSSCAPTGKGAAR